jgi:DNA-binding MarR family transcriptional regulator
LGQDESREARLALARFFRGLDVLEQHGLSVTSGRILVEVALQTWDLKRPRISSPVETAAALNLHISTVNRAMHKLASQQPDGYGLLQRSHGAIGSRSEGYALTDQGRQLAHDLMAVLHEDTTPKIEAQTIESFAEAVLIKKLPTTRLRRVAWDEMTRILTVSPPETAMSDEIGTWIAEFMSEGTSRIERDGMVDVKFVNGAEGFHFMLRWC